ncbi:DUF3861 domain-containing protein [Photobacterium sanguinicancri]|uniref:DUF3861 domain-containing protein n=1 Tax=Photobacterium sanguinicancri TaxID=875932 RepID=UPI0007880030|nr:DUF3861 domain-containing protein [Photobacterium sanguinicancri]KXI24472.1 hypothetical protein AS132_00345 [Photobacterium sanguinicancri]
MLSKMRKDNVYRITIEEISADQAAAKTLQFTYQDREDVFNVVEKLKQGSGLDENVATKVGVALRLLGPVMMQNRKHPLFSDFMPHFKQFMHHLKSTVKATVKQ